MRTNRRTLLAAVLLVACVSLAARCEGPGVAIINPSESDVLLAPEVVAAGLLWPPLGRWEEIHAELTLGLDSPDGQSEQDLTDQLLISSNRITLEIQITGLEPGRNVLGVSRELSGMPRFIAELFGLDPVVAQAERILDRGGFFPDAANTFSVGVTRDSSSHVGVFGEVREKDVIVWYPSPAEGPLDAELGAILDAPLVPDAAELPALLYSHGACGLNTHYNEILTHVARTGWIVVAMSHPGNTENDPNCEDPLALALAFFERPGDVVATLDWLLEENADPVSPLFEAIDEDRLGLAGHSFGGLTTLLTVPTEPRFSAALPMAPPYVLGGASGVINPLLPLEIPTMIQVGELDPIVTPEADAQPIYDKLLAPRYLVELLGSGHLPYVDGCGTDFQEECPDGIREVITQYNLGFLGTHVARDVRWAALLAPRAEVILTMDP
jgi:dienelactone hydrolase